MVLQTPAANEHIFLDENDLTVAFSTAALMLGKQVTADCHFKDYAGLKANATLRDGKITVKASRGFRSASSEVLLGLALGLLSRLFNRQLSEEQKKFVLQYKQFSGRESASKLHDALRERRGRKGDISPQGNFFDLRVHLNKVLTLYPEVLKGKDSPEITWSLEHSKRVLAWYDSAFHKIVVNGKLDRRGVPDYVIDYLVFHELLHVKYPTTFKETSTRRCVHSREFKQDEKQFVFYDMAEKWLKGK